MIIANIMVLQLHLKLFTQYICMGELAAFPKPSGDMYVWCGALMELWSAWGQLYVAVQLCGVD